MASIYKYDRSPYYFACWDGYVGARLVRMKKTLSTEDKKLARRIADQLEDAARGVCLPERIVSFLQDIPDLMTRRSAQHAFDYTLRQTTGRGLGSETTRGFVARWLERTEGEVSAATWAKYDQTTKELLKSLGGKADQDMGTITQDDVARFRDAQGRRVARTTANILLKIVRIIFAAAEADGVLLRNPARLVKKLKEKDGDRNRGNVRRAFKLAELKRILAVCDEEWRSLVLFGFYTGARLGDLARLTWQNLDLEAKELRYASVKTGRQVVIPLAAPLLAQIEQLPAGDDPQQPVHPRAFDMARRHGRSGALSVRFGDVLAAAGLVEARTHKADTKDPKGRNTRRTASALSFHCLRHTAVSLLKNAGVSDAVAQDLVGHDSAEVNRLYTHIEDQTKREAVNKLPVISGEDREARPKK